MSLKKYAQQIALGLIWISFGGIVAQPDLVQVEGGTFLMGCTAEQDGDCNEEESPVHEVIVGDFSIGAEEVSQQEWSSLFGDNPSFFDGCGVNCPVEQITWYQAIIYCNRLSDALDLTPCYYVDPDFSLVFGKVGGFWQSTKQGEVFWDLTANGYRLPTEAEWEFAARGGNLSQGLKYAGSNNLNEVAWYDNNSENTTREVGLKSPNELGLYDMNGNVWEWCWDWFDDSYYERTPFCNPLGSTPIELKSRRGGAWRGNANGSRLSNRDALLPNSFDAETGFRLARGAIDTANCSCTFSFSSEVQQPTCIAPSDGIVTLISDRGGVATNYKYRWEKDGEANEGVGLEVSNLTAGAYQVTLTDILIGCEAFGVVNLSIAEDTPEFTFCSVLDDVGIKGGSDGVGLITISGGATPFQINWTGPVEGSLLDGQLGDNSIEDLKAGNYDFEITDANGCVNQCFLIIEEPECRLQASVTGQDPICNGSSDGEITLSINNGIGPYRYDWDNNINSGSGGGQSITSLPAASYQITVTDEGNSCTQIVTIDLVDGELLSMVCAEERPSSQEGVSDGAATIQILNGEAPFTLSWMGASSGSLASIGLGVHTIENMVDGTYDVLLSDALGCVASCNLSVSAMEIDPCIENPVPLAMPKEDRIQICKDAIIPALEVIPQENLSFNWYQQDGTLLQENTHTLTVEEPGSYFVETVRLTDRCRSVDRVPIRVVVEPIAVTNIDQLQCIGEDQSTYLAQLSMHRAGSVNANFAPFSNEGNVYLFAGIPIEEPLEIEVQYALGCINREIIMPPNCNCPNISAPIIENNQLFYCPSEGMPVLMANVPSGQSIRWYTLPTGGEFIGEGPELLPPVQGQYYAEAYDISSGCVSDERVGVSYFPLAEPSIKSIAKICAPDQSTYTLILDLNNGATLEASTGQVNDDGENQFSIAGIPLENEIGITVTSAFSDCSTTFTALPPICGCEDLDAPTLATTTTEGAIVVYCSNQPKPMLSAISPVGTTVNWYDAPQGGNLLAASTHRFFPAGPGNYYMETIIPNGNCTSQERTGVRVEEIFQPFSIREVPICNFEAIVPPDTVAFAGSQGCDSLAITIHRFEGQIQEFLDTQFVCSILDTGIAIRYETFEGCSAQMITENVLGDFSDISLVVLDTIDNCAQMEEVLLSAHTPVVGEGQWRSLDGVDEHIRDPFSPQTSARMLRPGWNRFVWALSNDDCLDYAADTVSIWNPITVSAQDVVFEQVFPGASIQQADLLFNDTFLEGETSFFPINYPEDPNLTFHFDAQTGAYSGSFSYFSLQPTILQFNYELCDNRCLDISQLCDTAAVRVVVCDQSISEITFKNGFDPYLNEWFDPIGDLQAFSCDFGVDPTQITFRVYDKHGQKVYAPGSYGPWDGRQENTSTKATVSPDLYYWSLAIKVDQGNVQQTLEYTGSVLVYHGE